MIAVIEDVKGLERLVFGRENGIEEVTGRDGDDVLVVSLDRDVRARATQLGFRCAPDIVVGRVSTTRRRQAASTLARTKSRVLARPWFARLTRRYFTVFNVTYHGFMSALRGPVNEEADQIAEALSNLTAERPGERLVVDSVLGAVAVSTLDIGDADVVLL